MIPKPQIMTISLLLAVGLIACGSNDEPITDNRASSSTTPTKSSSEAGAPLDGTYEMTVTESDLSEEGGAQPGTWTITLTLDPASAHLSGPGGRSIPLDPTELTESGMVVPPDPACPNNDPAPGKGVYEVELSGDSLRFTQRKDPCGDRAFTLTVHAWERVEV